MGDSQIPMRWISRPHWFARCSISGFWMSKTRWASETVFLTDISRWRMMLASPPFPKLLNQLPVSSSSRRSSPRCRQPKKSHQVNDSLLSALDWRKYHLLYAQTRCIYYRKNRWWKNISIIRSCYGAASLIFRMSLWWHLRPFRVAGTSYRQFSVSRIIWHSLTCMIYLFVRKFPTGLRKRHWFCAIVEHSRTGRAQPGVNRSISVFQDNTFKTSLYYQTTSKALQIKMVGSEWTKEWS